MSNKNFLTGKEMSGVRITMGRMNYLAKTLKDSEYGVDLPDKLQLTDSNGDVLGHLSWHEGAYVWVSA